MVLPTAVHVVLDVHLLVFQHQQRREWRHDVHGLAQFDDLGLVGRRVLGQEAVDLQLGPGAWEIIGIQNIANRQGLGEGRTVESPGDDDGLWQGAAPCPRA